MKFTIKIVAVLMILCSQIFAQNIDYSQINNKNNDTLVILKYYTADKIDSLIRTNKNCKALVVEYAGKGFLNSIKELKRLEKIEINEIDTLSLPEWISSFNNLEEFYIHDVNEFNLLDIQDKLLSTGSVTGISIADYHRTQL